MPCEEQKAVQFYYRNLKEYQFIKHKALQKLLLYVLNGDQNNAKNLLEFYQDMHLISITGEITDCNGRYFKGTALQCAIANLDVDMFAMLIRKGNKIEDKSLLRQLEEIKKAEYTRSLIDDYKKMIKKYVKIIENINYAFRKGIKISKKTFMFLIFYITDGRRVCPKHILKKTYIFNGPLISHENVCTESDFVCCSPDSGGNSFVDDRSLRKIRVRIVKEAQFLNSLLRNCEKGTEEFCILVEERLRLLLKKQRLEGPLPR